LTIVLKCSGGAAVAILSDTYTSLIRKKACKITAFFLYMQIILQKNVFLA